MVTGTVPHVGGPVLPPAAPMVLIGGFPAARLGDMATCAGAPDSISKGAFPVPIANNSAARVSDQIAHGGPIAIGAEKPLLKYYEHYGRIPDFCPQQGPMNRPDQCWGTPRAMQSQGIRTAWRMMP
jgi:uncharacterized Zn-binding protein involved in type VI secretion